MSDYLAIDIGASSGRLILGSIKGGRLHLEEMHRFENAMVERNGHLCWDDNMLYDEIIAGLKKCRTAGKSPHSLAIDTWGVDFALVDAQGKMLGDIVAYRDNRTNGMDTLLEKSISQSDLYARTGIQKQPFNTIYQLLALKYSNPDALARAKRLLLMPEYLSYRLTGVMRNEYTNASTTGLLNAKSRDWDRDLMREIGIPDDIFCPVHAPGTCVGNLLPGVEAEVGFPCRVLLAPSHDTASAVLGAPLDENTLFLSSGTWSLMGAEIDQPVLDDAGRHCQLTNEGGYGGKIRYLVNIMGLWMIQRVRKELPQKYTYPQLSAMAAQHPDFPGDIDVNDQRLLNPDNMGDAVRLLCREAGQAVPQDDGELLSCIYNSLASSYAKTAKSIEKMTGRSYRRIAIVGGGSRDDYLNKLTAKACGLAVSAGPSEATAIGNILSQMIQDDVFADMRQARETVKHSFQLKHYGGNHA